MFVGERLQELALMLGLALPTVLLGDNDCIPLEACPAKIPSLLPGPEMGSFVHDGRKCIVEGVDLSRLGQLRRIRT